MFIDRAKIIVVSGAGGDGMVSFRREKYVPRGGPSGGDGGKGGSVFIKANSDLNTLINFRRHRKFAAKAGANGGAKEMFGKNAEDVFVEVPLGTMVYDNKTGELLADMTQNGQEALIVKGGHGGRGNSHFATSAVRAPLYAEKGEPGEEKELRLELKVLADVGLLGFPSVGKSSLIRKVSGAKPEVAAYHFTTLNPILGVVNLDYERSFVMADIPGLIEGASQGTGLGDEFLRHVERTKVLIHVLDAAGIDDPKKLEELKEAIEKEGYDFYPICTLSGEGTRPLIEAVWKLLQEIPDVSFESPERAIVYEANKQEFEIECKNDVYYIKGKRVEKLVGMTDFEDYVSMRRFDRAWRFMGLDKLLRKAGCQEGDTVNLYGVEFTWSENHSEEE